MAVLQLLGGSIGLAYLCQRYSPYPIGLILTTTLFFITSCISYAGFWIVIYPRLLSPLRHLPTPPDNAFFTGQTRQIMKRPSGMPQRDWVENVPNDGLIRYYMWFRERILLTNPKVLGEVLVNKNYDFVKPTNFKEGIGRLLGIGILFAEGDEHKRQRKNLMPAFSFRHIKDLYPAFWSKSREMVEVVAAASKSFSSPSEKSRNPVEDAEKAVADVPRHAPGVIEVGEFTSRATLDIIGLTGMGRDFGSLADPSNELNQTYRTIFNPSRSGIIIQIMSQFVPIWILRKLPLKRNDDISSASEIIKQTCRDLIANKRAKMAEKERTDVDIISVALESGAFSDEDLVNQMMTFVAAGHETTATAMIWAIYCLCKYPEIQQKLRDEVRSKLPSLNEDVTAAQIDNCDYLHAVCLEVLRVWSPVSLTLRTAAVDTSINGQFIPKGTTVIIPPWAVNMSTQLWGPDAREFKPERWIDADGKANNKGGADSNFSFLTFLHGPRSCIGQRFAQAEFECLLAAWVGRLSTEFEEGSPFKDEMPDIKGGITSKPKGGLWVKCTELEGW